MAVYSKKLHIKKGTSQQDINLYTTTGEVGNNKLCLKDGNTTVYAKLVSTSDSRASSLRVIKNNVTYAVAKTIVTQYYVPSQPSGPSTPTVEKIKVSNYGFSSMSLRLGPFGSQYGIDDISCSAGKYLDFDSAGGIIHTRYGSQEVQINLERVKIKNLSPNTRYNLTLQIGGMTMSDDKGNRMSFSRTCTATTGQAVSTDKDGKIESMNFGFYNIKTNIPQDLTYSGARSGSASISGCSFSATPA